MTPRKNARDALRFQSNERMPMVHFGFWPETLQKWVLEGQGATTKIYRDGDRAIKLHVGAALDDVEREAMLQEFAVRAGLPVPGVYGVRRIDESRIALEMAYIAGTPLLRKDMDKQQRRDAQMAFVKLQCAMYAIDVKGADEGCH